MDCEVSELFNRSTLVDDAARAQIDVTESKSAPAAKSEYKPVNSGNPVSATAQQVQTKATVARAAKPATSKLLGSSVREKYARAVEAHRCFFAG